MQIVMNGFGEYLGVDRKRREWARDRLGEEGLGEEEAAFLCSVAGMQSLDCNLRNKKFPKPAVDGLT